MPYYDSPCLMIPQGSNSSWKIFHSVYNDFYYLDLPELANAEIRYSKTGWLLLSRENTLFFFNPFTREQMEVPPSPHPFVSLCFTCPPTSRDCSVFRIYSTSTISTMDFGLIQIGQEEWEDYYYITPDGFSLSNCPPIFCNGNFYHLDKTGDTAVFNPIASDPYIVHDSQIGKELRQCYMAEVEGETWGVFVIKDDRRFLLMILDCENMWMCWKPISHLGNMCLYIGPNGSFAETSVDVAMANTTYFNKFRGHSGVLHSLSHDIFQSVNCNHHFEGSYFLTETGYNSAWIKPTSPPTILGSSDSSMSTVKLQWL